MLTTFCFSLFSCGLFLSRCGSLSFAWLVRLVVVLLDCQWLFLVAAMSGVGLFISEIAYAFCVLDVIPQVRGSCFMEAVLYGS